MHERKNLEIPRHVAIIPDGNRRWARQRGLKELQGHVKATEYEHLKSLFYESKKLGIKYLSLWGFSTENWRRSKVEINSLFKLLKIITEVFMDDIEKNKIRFRLIGRRDRLPKDLISQLEELENESKKFNNFFVNLCLDYGGRDEIIRGINNLIKNGRREISEENLISFLDTRDIPDPDLIIRTSGEMRLSGFMPWQSVYSELYFTKKYFPEFSSLDLRRAILEFGKRKRRFGK